MDIFGLSEPIIRLSVFATILASMALFELLHPRLERDEMRGALKSKRWFTNLSMLILSSLCLRIIFPTAAVGAALYFEAHQIGLFHHVDVPFILTFIICFVILDFIIWLEHVASHKIPLLWRIHRMHHSDAGFDVTTALRFHPIEIMLSMVWKILVIALMGAPAIVVLLFEIVLNGMAMFNHANIKLSSWLDRIIRPFFVTPDMHRVHHSTNPLETDSNYGFNFSLWDRLFKTYNDQPELGHHKMKIGLKEYGSKESARLVTALLIPFRK